MSSLEVDLSWKGFQSFPELERTCPKCAQSRNKSTGAGPLQDHKNRSTNCQWGVASVATIRFLDLSHNVIRSIDPNSLLKASNVVRLDLSSNSLKELPEELCLLNKLEELYVTNNALSTLPKHLKSLQGLKVLNLSGNAFSDLPQSISEVTSLETLHVGGNRIGELPVAISLLQRLEVLYLGGNRIDTIPPQVGEMKNLKSLNLCDNRLTTIPLELVKLRNLQSLSLHNNRLLYLPKEILELVNLVELSLRGNPMVIRFIQDLSCDPPSLLELASRTIRNQKLCYDRLPRSLIEHLNSAKQCPNPQCAGVYFDQKYHQIKFVDFCGKYRLPLMQYLCSPKCISYSSSASSVSSETESEEDMDGERMRRVLLG